MREHVKIMHIIHMFGRINTTRMAEFTGIPDIRLKNELEDLKQYELITESDNPKTTRTIWMLTEKGEKLLDYYLANIPEAVNYDISELNKRSRDRCCRILHAVGSGPKTIREISAESGIKKKELSMYIIFLEKKKYIGNKVKDRTMLHYLINNGSENDKF